jgi:D-alanine transaminase
MSLDTVFLNGQFLPRDEAKVSVMDRGFLFADGVYEVVPVVNGAMFDVKPCVERIANSLSELNIDWPEEQLAVFGESWQSQLVRLLEKLIDQNNLIEGGLYLQVTRGASQTREFGFTKGLQPTVMAFAFAKPIIDHPYKSGIDVVTVPDIRWARRDIKSVSLLAQCMAKQLADDAGAFECWMTEDGYVTEGSSSSSYIVVDGKIITRPLNNSILPGIRRRMLIDLCKEHDIELEQRAFSIEEALQADEAFISSATTLVLPVVRINDQTIGSGAIGPITEQARRLYLEHVYQTLHQPE